jgi:hypothetical protein
MEFKRPNSWRRVDYLSKPYHCMTTSEKSKSDKQWIKNVKIIE